METLSVYVSILSLVLTAMRNIQKKFRKKRGNAIFESIVNMKGHDPLRKALHILVILSLSRPYIIQDMPMKP